MQCSNKDIKWKQSIWIIKSGKILFDQLFNIKLNFIWISYLSVSGVEGCQTNTCENILFMFKKLFIFFNTSSDQTVYFWTFCNIRHESEREIASFNENSIVINGGEKRKASPYRRDVLSKLHHFFFPSTFWNKLD